MIKSKMSQISFYMLQQW